MQVRNMFWFCKTLKIVVIYEEQTVLNCAMFWYNTSIKISRLHKSKEAVVSQNRFQAECVTTPDLY